MVNYYKQGCSGNLKVTFSCIFLLRGVIRWSSKMKIIFTTETQREVSTPNAIISTVEGSI